MTEPPQLGSSFGDPGSYSPQQSASDFSRTSTVNLVANSSQYQQEMGAAAQATAKTGQAVGGLMTQVDNLFKSAGRKLEIGGAGVGASLGAGVASLGRLESQMGSLQATSVVAGKNYGDFTKAVDTSFGKFSNSRQEIVGLVTQIGSLSVKTRDINSITQTMVRLGAATGESIPQLTQGVVELGRSFGQVDAGNISKSANTLLTLSKNAGTTASSVLQFSQAIAPLSRQAGLLQKDVLGIATAFSKAGADGFAGANAFNSMINDINVSIKTGSPDIAKYSTLIGKTVEQFKAMPAKERVASIFDALGSGSQAAQNFVQDQGYGTRALSAYQAVAASGGIRQQLRVADNANPRNLQRGSDAALGGLNDSVGRVRNQIQRFGDIVAKPLLAPVTGLAKGLAWFLEGVNAIAKGLGPLAGIIGAISTVALPLMGFVLSHAALFTGLSLARTAIGKESAVRQGFGAGRMGGAPTGERFRDRASYAAGRIFNRAPMIGPVPPPNRLQRAAGYGLGVAQGARRFVFDSQTRMLNESRMTQAQRREALANRPTMRQQFGAFRADSQRMAQEGIARGVAQQGVGLVRAIGGVAVATTKAGMGVITAGTKVAAASAAGSVLRGPGAMMGGLRSGGAALGRGLGTVASAAFSLPGMLAMMVAVPAISKVIGSIQEKDKAGREQAVTDSLDPLKRYNDALGIATTKLADFSSKVDAAGNKAGPGGASIATSFGDAKQISKTEIGQYYGKGSSDPTVSALARGSNKGSIPRAVALMNSYNMTDPRQLDLFAQNLLGAGYTGEQVRQVLAQYGRGGKVDYKQMAKAINMANSGGQGSVNPSESSNRLGAAALTSLNVTEQTDETTHTAGYSRTKYLRDTLGFLNAQGAGANNEARGNQFENNLATLIGGKRSDVEDARYKVDQANKKPGSTAFGGFGSQTGKQAPKLNEMTDAQRQRYILQILRATPKGKDFLKGITQAGGEVDPTKFQDYLSKNFGIASDAQKKTAAQFGPLGRYATGSALVTSAVGGKSGDPATVQRAVQSLSTKALESSGDYTKASGSLTQLADKLGGSSTAIGRLVLAANAWTRQLQDLQLPNMSRAQQTDVLRGRMNTSAAAAAKPGASQETVDQAKNDKIAYEQQQNSNIQYLNNIYQQVRSFGIQRVRAEEDYNTQIFRSNQSFQIQMQQSEEDYLRSRSRNIKDFNTQMARQASQAARSIYNPFERVQSQSVVNGGILLDNLRDQNERIERQKSQVDQLKKAGLSQQAIDTLQLADPNNAQQTNSIARDIVNDPKTIKAINQQVQVRRKSTVSLTQSVVNEDFRNTMADFRKGLSRGAQDYQTAHGRAVSAQKLALTNMATDYRTMVRRTGEDLTTSMSELYGNFATTYARTLAKINDEIGDAIPALAKTLNGQLGKIGGGYGAAGGGDAGVSSSPVGSKTNPSYAAGRTGLNEKGVLGHYTSGGQFVKATPNEARGYGESGKKNYIANPKKAPEDSVYGWLYQAGWPRGERKTKVMHAIVLAESGGRPNAHNDVPPDDSYGLAQINMIGSLGPARRKKYGLKSNKDLEDPVTNLRIAKNMSGNGSNFSPWTTFTRGTYKQYMAAGGVTTRSITVGEAGHEAVVPLDSARGVQYTANMYDKVSLLIAGRLQHAAPGYAGTGHGSSGPDNRQWHEDHSVHFDGQITVMADDPNRMEKELMARARTKRLTQPASSVH